MNADRLWFMWTHIYAFKLKQLLRSFNRKEKDLPSIFADIIHMAEDCAGKKSTEKDFWPIWKPLVLNMKEPKLKLTKQVRSFNSISAIVAFHQVLFIIHFSLCYSSSTRAVRLRNAKKELMFPLQLPVKKGIYLIFNYPW